MENSVFIDRVSWKAKELIAKIADGGEFNISPFPTTVKHIDLCLDNLFLIDEQMAKDVAEGLELSLKEGKMRFNGEDKWTNFFIATLYQMIQRDEMYGDIIYSREEFNQ